MQDFVKRIEFMSNQEESQRLFDECFIPNGSENDININAEVYEELLEKGKYAEIFTSEINSEDACLKATQEIINSVSSIDTIAGVIFRFNIHPDIPMLELSKALELFDSYNENAILIFGTLVDQSLKLDYAKVSAIIIYKEAIKS